MRAVNIEAALFQAGAISAPALQRRTEPCWYGRSRAVLGVLARTHSTSSALHWDRTDAGSETGNGAEDDAGVGLTEVPR